MTDHWKDVRRKLGIGGLGWLIIQEARAKDAELLADAEMRRLNDVSNAADTERRRWYAAIGGDLTGLSPEVVASRLREDRATAERTILALYAELAAKDAEIAQLRAQCAILQIAPQAQGNR